MLEKGKRGLGNQRKGEEMTEESKNRKSSNRGRPPKPAPAKISANPERVARAMFSAVKRPDPSIRVPKTANRKPRPDQ